MEDNKEQDNQVQIELSEEVAQGTYSNLAIISHSSSEFVLILLEYCQDYLKQKLNQE